MHKQPHFFFFVSFFLCHHKPPCLRPSIPCLHVSSGTTWSRCGGEALLFRRTSCPSDASSGQDGNPMSHRRQQVLTWLPQWHAAQSHSHLHNSAGSLLSHQPCFISTVTIGCSRLLKIYLSRLNDAIKELLFPRRIEAREVKSDANTRKSVSQNRGWIKWSRTDEKKKKRKQR